MMQTQIDPQETAHDTTRRHVRERYARIAQAPQAKGCCAPSCCSSHETGESTPAGVNATQAALRLGYSSEQAASTPDGANLGLGCGNPLAIGALLPGQTVLDLGSGAGFDAFLAARAVGPTGRVIGVDMTPEMVTKARANARRGNFPQVDFRLGEIEHLPVQDSSVDVILSNCVINLSPNKAQVFVEAFRVLKPGGRLAISDIIALQPAPEWMRRDVELYTACASGAAEIATLETALRTAGFSEIRIEPKPESREALAEWFPGKGLENYFASATIKAVKPAIKNHDRVA